MCDHTSPYRYVDFIFESCHSDSGVTMSTVENHCQIQTDLDALVVASQRYGWAVARGQQEAADQFLTVVRSIKSKLSNRVSGEINHAYVTGVADARH
jgi:hypothetical protein